MDGGVETGGGEGGETGSGTEEEGKLKLTTGIDSNITPDFKDKEDSTRDHASVTLPRM